ncbi:heme-binding protein 2-like [Dreissena polymorpha]|uniref:SOUL heme-binding protein n=1 Tax=Dreissena polymorpha TaxID=45954 RepID=A0A9D4H5V6_DREPO|nr:heme-binding protein 2-like [Dreissena polymorpha]KAH3827998.1 hypothetical protein DPMN_129946 [Dreissena polymorpha]
MISCRSRLFAREVGLLLNCRGPSARSMSYQRTAGESGVERPPYTVVDSRDGYEERKYVAAKWVSTTVESMTRQSAVSTAFQRLFNYISGENDLKTKVDMTAPVATRIVPGAGPNCESTFTVSFYIPPKHQKSAPAPTRNGVFIESFPQMTVYASGFGGFADDGHWVEHARELSEKLKQKNIHREFYFTAGYDSPFKMSNRLNEVWFVKKDS